MRGSNVDNLNRVLSIIDASLNTKRKRHIAGDVFISISLLFGSLAFTVTTLKTEVKNE